MMSSARMTVTQTGANLTKTTTMNSYHFSTTDGSGDASDLKRVLVYAVPLAFCSIVMVLLIAMAIHRRRRVLEKWAPLKRMRNTNPRCLERSGLRRDSEFETTMDEAACVTTVNEDRHYPQEPQFRLSTIT